MLPRPDLERLSSTVSRGNVGHAEVLYLQDIVLSTISRETGDELVFKGGTALLKFYQLDRFSEDLDFTAREPVQFPALLESAIRDLENFGATVADRRQDESDRSYTARLGIEGPLYTGDRRSLCFLRLEINKRSDASRIETERYTPQFPDIPAFDLVVLAKEELLAEKIRALLTRDQPRDLYDMYHLLGLSVRIEPTLVQDKLAYYGLDYDQERILAAARDRRSNWDTLDALVYSRLPAFEDVIGELERALPRRD